MFKRILRSVAPMALAVMAAAPLVAQVPLPPAPAPSLEIRVGHTAPPPLRNEEMGRRPSRDHVWARGSWDWQGNDWAWTSGRWERPERRNSRWIVARYVREGSGYRYEPAHWSYQRVVEGEDYRRWKTERHGEPDRKHDDRDHDRNRNPDREHGRPN